MKALIAMSGGVDSSVAAKLTQEAGYECIGCTMKLFDDPNEQTSEDPAGGISDAEAVAQTLGMDFHVFDMRDEFKANVIDDFIKEYSSGRTPNPCIVCNKTMKFGGLLEKATKLGCDKIVTGHYGKVSRDPDTGLYSLKKATDLSKDQSYVLYHLSQDQLSHLLLPLGDLTKDQVRGLAAEAGFKNADRPESQDICFVPDGKYAEKIYEYSGKEFPPGEFVDLDGNIMGEHKGIIHYTIGQHKRLGQAFGVPRYVCSIDAKKNRITLGGPDDVFSSEALLSNCSWISGRIPADEIRCKVRLRYKQQEQWARILPSEHDPRDLSPSGNAGSDHGTGSDSVRIIFDEPQRAITPGQAAVFYDEDMVLGGGTIL